ncbi:MULTISPECIES: SDR family oxidoreductase [Prauserella salsuginis group]|uniref:Meso-butanediol dehydrogenase/(S,S)-butanediol dehydrogenase/diacetyl reductase n=2 Tax=Prauserella salsuginis group TaxID=2893672 RepID=A0A839XE34_9PSEU|nr:MULTISPECIES: SDR family oxidoreductase [Prauserella salsuginis group]MBB3662212.1 meso-butanediol dehydrogenase/(S,S)-butanediol dehydrogenase/diacetyl reductase [Prauserella sediminis]MCR3719903.1 meso-butanediol dehydrogenase / (S,S)-butanediol dehydrogenase / diacetyl reductase [Prauserella flava]MCR3736554.1 meso-butanediol dehydrogenase / (S,S)-butanediol dehydrogenase / diacetyl reductase [Prauserella salsuginis]
MNDTRVAIVTGAAGGIGRAVARRLADDGFRVAVSDLASTQPQLDELAGELAARGVLSHALAADVTDEADMARLVETTVDALGDLDVMVANAGIVSAVPLLELSTAEWDRVMSVNARGALVSYQAAARQLIRQGHGGKIIGAASVAAHQSSALVGHYSASKFAVRALTQAAALEWAEHGIVVNAYSPGLVHTSMWDDLDREMVALQGGEPGDVIAGAVPEIPLGRVQRPEDVAGVVSYLASADADYMTGQSVVVDGGMLLG